MTPMSTLNSERRQRLCILGSTGSVGTSTLDVLSRHPERFEVFALTAHSRVDELLTQCLIWKPRFAALPTPELAQALQVGLRAAGSRTEVLVGAQALCDLAAHADVDMVMASIVGAADLSIAKIVSSPVGPFFNGQNLTYTLTVSTTNPSIGVSTRENLSS